MANTDRPNGLLPAKTMSGAPWTSVIRTIIPKDGVDLFLGDAITLDANGTADRGASNDAAFLGVVVGFGKKDSTATDANPFAYNPSNLEVRWYDDSANTNTEWAVFYVPADDVLFEAQTATALTLEIGDTCDLSPGSGNATTGVSDMELTTSSAADFTVMDYVRRADNDKDLVNGRYIVMFTRAEQAFHA